MDGKTLHRKLQTQVGMTFPSIAEAAWEIAGRDDLADAWAAVRPHDARLHHAIRVILAALRRPDSVPDRSLASLAISLGEAADDVRRWADGDDRFVCARAVAAACAVDAAVLCVVYARAGDHVWLATSACSCARMVAEATIEPVDEVRDDLVRRAERIAREPLPEEQTASMATGGEG